MTATEPEVEPTPEQPAGDDAALLTDPSVLWRDERPASSRTSGTVAAELDLEPEAPLAASLQLTLPALAALLLQLLAIGRYGWFRDELYYAACGRHLAFGYVDHPPFVALAAWFSRTLLGDGLPAMRLLPALAGALVVYLTGRLARELGGGRFAQLAAAVCALAAPRFLNTFHTLSTNLVEIVWWTVAALILARLASGAAPSRHWLWFGAAAGMALESKHSGLLLGLGVAVGLLLTADGRRHLRQPWVYLGGLLAAVLFLPNLIWELVHGWPTLEFLRHAQAVKNTPLSPPQFLLDQVLAMQPLAAPIWAGGLAWLLLARGAQRFRILGWICLTVLLVLLAFRAKGYYLAPIFPMLFAAGAAAMERLLPRRDAPAGEEAPEDRRAAVPLAAEPSAAGRWRHVGQAAIIVLLLAGGALEAPLGLPLLPIGTFVRYQAALGVAPRSGERHQLAELPQHYADMFGWPQLALAVARAVFTLPAADRRGLCVLAQNYGEAGAIEQFGRPLGLPPAISGHNNYALWGPGGCGGQLLVLGGTAPDHASLCADLRQTGTVRSRYAMPYENNLPIWFCRLRRPLSDAWPSLHHYDGSSSRCEPLRDR